MVNTLYWNGNSIKKKNDKTISMWKYFQDTSSKKQDREKWVWWAAQTPSTYTKENRHL